MKTIRLEDELHKALKRRAVDTEETLEQLAARLLGEGLAREGGDPVARPQPIQGPRKAKVVPEKRALPTADELEAEVARIEAEEGNSPEIPDSSIPPVNPMARDVMAALADDPDEESPADALDAVKAWLGKDYVPEDADAVYLRGTTPLDVAEVLGQADGKWMIEGQYSDPDGQLVTPFFKIVEDGVERWEDYEKEELPGHVVEMLKAGLAVERPPIRLKEVKG